MTKILTASEIENPVIPFDKELESIFSLQKELLEPYIGIEGLPPYPLDTNIKENQVLVKDFVARVVNELGEAFESTIKLRDLIINEPEVKVHLTIPELENFNMECSDALHFMIETLIYLNIEPDSIRNYIYKILKAFGLNPTESLLIDILTISRCINNSHQIEPFSIQRGRNIINEELVETNESLRGGRKISNYQVETSKSLLWDITYWLQLSRGCMKNNAWKQTEEDTEEDKLQLYIMEAFMAMFRYFDFMGMTSISIYTIYYKKNKINVSRIKNKY